eukprot:436441_1
MSLFTRILGSKYPIMQAPMAGVTTPSFVCAVSNSGAVGSHGISMISPDGILSDIKQIKQDIHNNAPFSVNLMVLPEPPTNQTNPELSSNLLPVMNVLDRYYIELNIPQPKSYDKYGENFEDQFEMILQETVPIFSFCFGSLSKEQVALLKKKDIVVVGSATNINEGQYLYEIGCDMIIAQGTEAGGHRSTFFGDFNDSLIGVMALVPSIIDRIDNKIPVIPAGGIMNGKGLNASHALGGCGVSMGTVFMNTEECKIADCYKLILRDEQYNTNTTITNTFSGRPARGIQNRFINDMNDISISIPPYPIMNKLTNAMRAEAKKQNKTDLMSLWCGQSASMLNNYKYNIKVNELIEQIMIQSD